MPRPETEHPNVERLDFTKPPPGYTIAWLTHSSPEWVFRIGVRDDLNQYGSEDGALSAAWTHYKARRDPPGMTVAHAHDEDGNDIIPHLWGWVVDGHDDSHEENTEAQQASVEARLVRDEAEARAAAWAWYGRRLALDERLQQDVIACPRCYSRDAHTENIDATTCTQPWCTECDEEMGGLGFDDLWPVILTWPDDQVAEVERWFDDPTAEMPEVLRA